MSDRDAPAGDERQGDRWDRRRDGRDRFPGERRTTTGRFSGSDDRLVHVRPDGTLRDFGYPLSGLSGIEDSRFGLRIDGEVVGCGVGETTQRYVGNSTLIETVHRTRWGEVERLDLSLDRAHLTRFDLSPLAGRDEGEPTDVAIVASVDFAPDGRAERVGQLRFADAVELFHAGEHDFLASSSGFADVVAGGVDPEELSLADGGGTPGTPQRHEEGRLSRSVTVTVVPEDHAVTLATLLTDRAETTRETARERLGELLERFDGRAAFERAAREGGDTLPVVADRGEGTVADLRALSLLSAPTGLRIAGPDFDPGYRHSGGYGYTWFRDDAEIAGYLLAVDETLGLGLDRWHRRNADLYCRIQLPDGTWPHRVWPVDGSLAPGWANSRIETGDDGDYQADQTASVVAFLARLRDRLELDDEADADLAMRVDDALAAGLDGLDASLEADGRPGVCQNAWEDAEGRFVHTAATFLEAYAFVAAAGSIDDDLRERALDRARQVYAAIDDLWIPDRGTYAVAERPDGERDPRLDSASLALARAHRAYDRVAREDDRGVAREDDRVPGVDDERVDRLASHVAGVIDGLYRDPEGSAIEGLVRYEGDEWRAGEQPEPKIWTVSTAWAAAAAAELSALLSGRGARRAAEWGDRGRELLAVVEPDGSLAEPTGYLPEQYFDDGTPDSATPLGWPHAIRLYTRTLLAERGHLDVDGEAVTTD